VILIRRRFRRAEISELVDVIEKTIALKGRIAILRESYVEIVE